MRKEYNDLTFTDDFMFCKVMQDNPELTRQLVELILGVRIDRIEWIAAQHTLEDSVDSKGIRMDVYFEDNKNIAYDIEMQTYTDGNLVMRNRYYHSLIAVDSLNRGGMYNDVKRSYVIFICKFDPFKLNSPIYTARTRFDEHPDEIVDDGAISVFLNCDSDSGTISPELQKFFRYVREDTPSEGLTEAIESGILKAKNQKKWRREYMTLFEHEEHARAEGRAEGIIEGRAEGITEGRAEGIVEGKLESAVNAIPKMLDRGISLEDACEIQSISIEEYRKLQAN